MKPHLNEIVQSLPLSHASPESAERSMNTQLVAQCLFQEAPDVLILWLCSTVLRILGVELALVDSTER